MAVEAPALVFLTDPARTKALPRLSVMAVAAGALGQQETVATIRSPEEIAVAKAAVRLLALVTIEEAFCTKAIELMATVNG